MACVYVQASLSLGVLYSQVNPPGHLGLSDATRLDESVWMWGCRLMMKMKTGMKGVAAVVALRHMPSGDVGDG